MAETELGTLVIRVRAVADGVQQVMGQSVNILKQVGTAGTQAQRGLEQTAASIRKTAAESQAANTQLSQLGSNTDGIDKFDAKLDSLNAKYELQSNKVAKLSAELDLMADQYLKLEQAAGNDVEAFDPSKIFPDISAQLDAEMLKLDSLQTQIQVTTQQREQAALKAEESARRQAAAAELAAFKQETLNQKMSDKQATADAKLGYDAVALAIRGVSSVSGGAVGQVGQLASQVLYLKRTMQSTASAGAAMGAAITGGIMIAVTVVSSLINSYQQAKEEAKNAAKEAATAYSLVNEELESIIRNMEVLKSSKSSVNDVTEAKEELVSLMPEMVTRYNAEGEAILANNDALEQHIEYLKQLNDLEREKAAVNADESLRNYDSAIEKLSRLETQLKGIEHQFDDIEMNEDLAAMRIYEESESVKIAIINQANTIAEAFKTAKTNLIAKIEQEGGTEIAQAMYTVIDEGFLEANSDKNADELAQMIIDQYETIMAAIPPGLSTVFSDLTPELQGQYFQMISDAFGGDFDNSAVSENISKALADMINDADLSAAIDKFQQLKEKIESGTANTAEMKAYDTALIGLNNTLKGMGQTLKNNGISNGIQIVGKAFGSLTKDAKSAKQIIADLGAERAKAGMMDLSKGVNDVYSSYRKLNEELSDIRAMKAVANALEQGKGAEGYADALAYVADMYGVGEDEALGYLDALNAEISAKELLAQVNIETAYTELQIQTCALQAAAGADGASADIISSCNRAIAGLESLKQKMEETWGVGTEMGFDIKKLTGGSSGGGSRYIPRSSGGGRGSGGGGGGSSSQKNTALEEELNRLEHKRKMDDLTYSEEIAWLKRIRNQHAKTNEERLDLDEQLYAARKQKWQAEFDYKKSMDQMSLQEEVRKLEKQRAQYKKGTEARMEIDQQLYEAKKQLWQAEFDHKKNMDKMTLAEEIKTLEKRVKQYKKGTEQRMQLEQQLHEAKKQLWQSDLDYKKSMDQLTLQEEVKSLEKQVKLFKKGTEQRRELEQQLYQAKKDLERQIYENYVYFGQLTLREQEFITKAMIQDYKKGTQARIELEKQLYDIQQQIREQNISSLDNLADGITTALRNRYEEQRSIEQEHIQQSIDAWKEWGDEQIKLIDEQIKALEDITKEEDRAEEERKKRRKIAALEQQLQYEQDEYNQRKLMGELAKAEEDLQKYLTKIEREDAKNALQAQKDVIKEQVQTEQDALNKQLDNLNDYYDELLKEANLRAEAERMLVSGNQKEILSLIQSFAPDYNATGQTLGEKLVDGFTRKVGSIETWFENFNKQISRYQDMMAAAATKAADQFWESRGGVLQSSQTAQPTTVNNNVQLVINQPVQSPVEFRREVERILLEMSYMQK